VVTKNGRGENTGFSQPGKERLPLKGRKSQPDVERTFTAALDARTASPSTSIKKNDVRPTNGGRRSTRQGIKTREIIPTLSKK